MAQLLNPTLLQWGPPVEGGIALKLVAEAAEASAAAGLAWREGELLLRPADRLVELIRRSHDLAAVAEADGD